MLVLELVAIIRSSGHTTDLTCIPSTISTAAIAKFNLYSNNNKVKTYTVPTTYAKTSL